MARRNTTPKTTAARAATTPETTAAQAKAATAAAAKTDAGADQVQKKTDAIEEDGYFGRTPDPTPNENYSVKGVTSDKPTPETDPKLAAKARQERDPDIASNR